jgi:RNA polymerase sigma-70 factor (ECF subfamily)
MFRATAVAPADDDEKVVALRKEASLPSTLNDVVRGALRGDPLAVRDFLQAVAPVVRRICRGVMGREDPELEDAIQECLIDVARALPHFRFESDVSHYVTKIAMRRAIAARQRARARARQHTGLDAAALSVANLDGAPDAHADLVRHLLDGINEEQATALLLHVMLGHSIEEIASITGVSVNTVKTRLRLGKKQLRRWFERRGEGPRAR